jgi:hypothetical protein
VLLLFVSETTFLLVSDTVLLFVSETTLKIEKNTSSRGVQKHQNKYRKAKSKNRRCEKETFLSGEKKIDLSERQQKTTSLRSRKPGFLRSKKNEVFLHQTTEVPFCEAKQKLEVRGGKKSTRLSFLIEMQGGAYPTGTGPPHLCICMNPNSNRCVSEHAKLRSDCLGNARFGRCHYFIGC